MKPITTFITILLGALLLISYSQLLVGDVNKLPFGGPDLFAYLNTMRYDVNQLKEGKLPVFNEQVFCGQFPEYASPLSPIWYPPALALWYLFSDGTAYRLFLLLHGFIAVGAFYVFSQRFTQIRWIRIVVATGYAICGEAVSLMTWGPLDLFAAFAFIPLALHYINNAIEGGNDSRKAGMTIGLFGLMGAWHIVFSVGLYAFLVWLFAKRKPAASVLLYGLGSFFLVAGLRIVLIASRAFDMVRERPIAGYGHLTFQEGIGLFLNVTKTHANSLVDTPTSLGIGIAFFILAAIGLIAARKTTDFKITAILFITCLGLGTFLNYYTFIIPVWTLFPDMARVFMIVIPLIFGFAITGAAYLYNIGYKRVLLALLLIALSDTSASMIFGLHVANQNYISANQDISIRADAIALHAGDKWVKFEDAPQQNRNLGYELLRRGVKIENIYASYYFRREFGCAKIIIQ